MPPQPAHTGFAPPSLSGRIPSLDGLRALSILLVLLGHAAMSDGAPHALHPFAHVGNIGVRFFFVISGFLITTLLLKEQAKSGTISLRQFYLRRTLRIFPAAYFFIAVVAALAALHWIRLIPHEVLYAATYTMNYHDYKALWLGQLWSLAVEEQFYLIWPGLMLLAGARRAFRGAWIAVVLVPLLRAWMWFGLHASETSMTKHFEAVADALAIGCLLAAYYNRLGASERYRRLQRRTLVFLGGAFALILTGNALFLVRPGLFYVAGQTLANIGTVFAIDWAIRHPDHALGRLLNARPMIAIGVLSYSLYLWQNPFLLGDLENVWTTFPQNLLFAVAAALFSYFAIEKPFLRLKDRFEGRRRGSGTQTLERPAPAPELRSH
ncbi:MAG: acyltransferase [Acidobacteriota bacterium]|nr:acyltransferase [Acidobacteriota bacterium]